MSPTVPPKIDDSDLYIVGRYIAETAEGNVWELDSVWTTFDSAVEACRDEDYFVAPQALNTPGPHETEIFPWFCYPKDEIDPCTQYPEINTDVSN
jgi:hypothetical protein